MTTYISSINAEGEVQTIYRAAAIPVPVEGTDPDFADNTIVHVVGAIADLQVFADLHYYSDGEWVGRDPKPAAYYDWKDGAWALDSAALFTLIRQQRDNRLYASDWTQLADVNLSDALSSDWADYRLALRSVPADNSGVTSLDEVTWPVAP
jgi:hypothetical protein